MIDIYCPSCEHIFEGEPWEPGKCPQCGKNFHWDDLVAEDYSDSWAIVEWDD